jgi:hypothetical protein
MPWYSTWSGKWPAQTSDAVWKSNLADERIITIEDMPGWDKYSPGSSLTTRLATAPQFRSVSETVGVFDLNGHYMGKSIDALPQGRYIVRGKVQGRTESRLYIKK